jgi:hypothetical protein
MRGAAVARRSATSLAPRTRLAQVVECLLHHAPNALAVNVLHREGLDAQAVHDRLLARVHVAETNVDEVLRRQRRKSVHPLKAAHGRGTGASRAPQTHRSRRVRKESGMPCRFPLGVVERSLMSACASTQTTPRRGRAAKRPLVRQRDTQDARNRPRRNRVVAAQREHKARLLRRALRRLGNVPAGLPHRDGTLQGRVRSLVRAARSDHLHGR